MPRFDLRRDGPAMLVVLAIVAVALSILNYRLNRAQFQNQVTKAKYELQSLQQAMAAYTLEHPQTPLYEIILKAKTNGAGYFHQGYLIQDSTSAVSVQLLPKDSLQGYVYPMPMPGLPAKQRGEDFSHEKFYGVISKQGKEWRLAAQQAGDPLRCSSLGDHNMAESSFHLRFEWPDGCLRDQDHQMTAWSPGPYVDYTLNDAANIQYDPSNGLLSHGFIFQKRN
ncbi:MAG: type II secretion system protein [Candidatus Hinthialibacter antarcticus]|nr:type II secretion system protein [Candidatus Hinthialibacter antarcticus]